LLGKQLGFDAIEVVMNIDQAPIKATEGNKKASRIKTG
jgi:type I restriction enzyme R subunit